MGKPVDVCCCCIELRTGSLIIGYLSLIGYILNIIDIIRTIGATEATEKLLVVSLYAALIIIVLNIIFTVVLLLGLHGEKPDHVKAFLIYSVIFLVLEIITRLYISLNIQNKELRITVFVILAIGTLLEIYFLLVIQSQYCEMKNPTTQSDVYHIPTNYDTHNPAISSYPVNGPVMNHPAINSHTVNIPANYSHPVNSPSMYPAVNSSSVNNHANFPTASSPPYGFANSPSHNYPPN